MYASSPGSKFIDEAIKEGFEKQAEAFVGSVVAASRELKLAMNRDAYVFTVLNAAITEIEGAISNPESDFYKKFKPVEAKFMGVSFAKPPVLHIKDKDIEVSNTFYKAYQYLIQTRNAVAARVPSARKAPVAPMAVAKLPVGAALSVSAGSGSEVSLSLDDYLEKLRKMKHASDDAEMKVIQEVVLAAQNSYVKSDALKEKYVQILFMATSLMKRRVMGEVASTGDITVSSINGTAFMKALSDIVAGAEDKKLQALFDLSQSVSRSHVRGRLDDNEYKKICADINIAFLGMAIAKHQELAKGLGGAVGAFAKHAAAAAAGGAGREAGSEMFIETGKVS